MKAAILLRQLAALWGVTGVVAFLCYPVYRLSAYAWSALNESLNLWQWFLLLAFALFMAYSEGYQGFQKNFSPRVAARALYLSRQAGWLNGLLAPVFCIGYFGTTRRRQVSILLLTAMIVTLVYTVSQLPQPWRGMIDAGVVVGLVWGLLSLLYFVWQAFMGEVFAYSPELSAGYQAKITDKRIDKSVC